MKYLVIAKYWVKDCNWKTYQKEFNDKESADMWAKEMYDSCKTDRGEEVTVLFYELISSLN